MNEIKSYKIYALSETLSPLTHMMGVSGNESIINREKVLYNGQLHDIPAISGNALRHSLVREPGAMLLCKLTGMYGNLTIDQANFLFYGGSLTDSSTTENLKRIASMQTLMPLMRLLGGSLRNQVVSGALLVGRGALVCEENRDTLAKLLPESLRPDSSTLRSYEDFVSNWQYTRGDASRKPDVLAETEEAPEKSNLMIYAGQHVIPGALFAHTFILQNITRLELGALFASFEEWRDSGSAIGGSSRIGHGQINTAFTIGEPSGDFYGQELNPQALAAEYRQHTIDNSAEIAEWLNSAFPEKKPAKKTSKKAEELQDAFWDGV